VYRSERSGSLRRWLRCFGRWRKAPWRQRRSLSTSTHIKRELSHRLSDRFQSVLRTQNESKVAGGQEVGSDTVRFAYLLNQRLNLRFLSIPRSGTYRRKREHKSLSIIGRPLCPICTSWNVATAVSIPAAHGI